ncbi:hypothetical protein BX600DRAFT_72683 [Xylariales sp. PMI_506]|nr:hypothetical protein BX600DRAFT_440204 [Xylariales sp. PMI_506]KAH8655743.1 hypothetical protein BX600DRAFT_72683 [Xylariales sp. PMI_506]
MGATARSTSIKLADTLDTFCESEAQFYDRSGALIMSNQFRLGPATETLRPILNEPLILTTIALNYPVISPLIDRPWRLIILARSASVMPAPTVTHKLHKIRVGKRGLQLILSRDGVIEVSDVDVEDDGIQIVIASHAGDNKNMLHAYDDIASLTEVNKANEAQHQPDTLLAATGLGAGEKKQETRIAIQLDAPDNAVISEQTDRISSSLGLGLLRNM